MRKPYDRTLKQVLTKELKSRDPDAQISIDYPVSQEGFTIDLVFKSSTKLAKEVDFPPFLLTPHLCCQFKHAGSTLYPLDFQRLLAQALLYACQENIEDYEEVSLVLVVSRVAMDRFKGRKVYALNRLIEGVYLEDMKCRTVVIESNELSVIPENYPYLLISEGDKRRQFIDCILSEVNNYYITQAYKLYPEEVKTMAEEKGIELEEVLTPRVLIQDLGHKKIIETLLEEELLTPKQLIQDLGSEKIIETLLEEELLTPKQLIQDLGSKKIIETLLDEYVLAPEDLIENIGTEKIIGALLKIGAAKKIIEELGIGKIVEEVGIEKIREYLKGKGISC